MAAALFQRYSADFVELSAQLRGTLAEQDASDPLGADFSTAEQVLAELREVKRSMDMAGRDSAVAKRPEVAGKLKSFQKELEDLAADVRLVGGATVPRLRQYTCIPMR